MEAAFPFEAWADFDALRLDAATGGESLVALGMHFFPRVTFPCAVDSHRFRACLTDIQNAYTQVPYHNRIHAADVAHASMWLIRGEENLQEISGVLLMAALVHDCGHFGRTNGFLCRSNHALAQRHGNSSPLEHYHLEIAEQILRKHEIFPLDVFEREVLPVLRRLVLATDLARKFPITDIPALVIRAADVSAMARNFRCGLRWGEALHLEFLDQRKEETSLGIEHTEIDTSDPNNSSIVFARDVVLPLFRVLVSALPGRSLALVDVVETLATNLVLLSKQDDLR